MSMEACNINLSPALIDAMTRIENQVVQLACVMAVYREAEYYFEGGG